MIPHMPSGPAIDAVAVEVVGEARLRSAPTSASESRANRTNWNSTTFQDYTVFEP
jgi:hypothetical protein